MSAYDQTLAVPGTTGWVLPISAQLNPTWDQTNGYSANGGSMVSHNDSYYIPYNAGIVQDISSYPTELNAKTKCFVSANVGDLVVTDVSATYNVTLSDNQTLTQVSLAYDNILDYTLSEADSIAFLNSFSVSGLKLSLPQGTADQAAAGATCSFSTNGGVVPILEAVLTSATDASGDVAASFLAKTLNHVLMLAQVDEDADKVFTTAYVSAVNGLNDLSGGPNINPSDIDLGIDVSSSVVTIDANSSANTVGTKCYGVVNNNDGAQALINQIDTDHINAYASTTTDTINTTAFPGLPGDQFVFGLLNNAPQVRFLYNKATSSAPNDAASLNLPFLEFTTDPAGTCPIRDNNWVLAFRITLSKLANSQAGVGANLGSGEYLVGPGGLTSVV
jgi:hypothetical protein